MRCGFGASNRAEYDRALVQRGHITPAVSDDDAKQRFGDFEVVLPYLRKTKPPGA